MTPICEGRGSALSYGTKCIGLAGRDDPPAAPLTDDPDAWPTRQEDATADRMCRWLTRSARQRAERLDEIRPAVMDADGNPKGGPGWPLFAANNAAYVNTWSLIFVLRSLLPEQADHMARALWRAWGDETHMRETLAEWAKP